MFRIICLIIGYFFGCIQTSYFVGKKNNIDISKTGSGNLGTTNTVRAVSYTHLDVYKRQALRNTDEYKRYKEAADSITVDELEKINEYKMCIRDRNK